MTVFINSLVDRIEYVRYVLWLFCDAEATLKRKKFQYFDEPIDYLANDTRPSSLELAEYD